MTTIKSNESGSIRELECVIDGSDILSDVMGGSGISRDVEDADFVVDEDSELDWWERWARREELISYEREEADEETIAADDQLIADWGYDMETLQDKECELFGIDY